LEASEFEASILRDGPEVEIVPVKAGYLFCVAVVLGVLDAFESRKVKPTL
jgi:hypothetical protein